MIGMSLPLSLGFFLSVRSIFCLGTFKFPEVSSLSHQTWSGPKRPLQIHPSLGDEGLWVLFLFLP